MSRGFVYDGGRTNRRVGFHTQWRGPIRCATDFADGDNSPGLMMGVKWKLWSAAGVFLGKLEQKRALSVGVAASQVIITERIRFL